ncbi:LysR family transcriptional regulator [Hoeflea prorocentri]|uniref:LysR family transcriptional regulator n=1 Tax=Hoeflea prorocentri TaxID=1922333 RepID=A0A9X3UQZ3_9HYPH|nr:LysR family transcriptional regulator [Hoeflea prorocentri]MCY6383601.1 LysR family transcriptional regulator [Hoeflea prorocentri]MDA5401401.1 LysR family transcriptional regulator [Hoeflea prorocentri]
MKLDPKHLSQLSVIVEAGSFQAAADRLGLTQPALSRNMRTLEQRLGTPLFSREGRRSIPNKLGLRLARNGLAIRVAEEQASVVADQSAKGATGELRIGAPPIVAGRFLTDALSRFIVANPNCSIELRTGLVHELRSMLERGQIDLVLGPRSLAGPADGLEFQHLIDDRVGVLCRVAHVLAGRQNILPSDLEAQTWLAHSRGSLLRQQTETALIASGIKTVHIAVETDSIRSVLEIVASTDLITTMPRATTAPYLEDELVFLDFDHPQFYRPLGIIRRAGMAFTGTAESFFSFLKG